MIRKLIALRATLAGTGLVGHLLVNVPEPVHMGASRPVQQLLDLLLYTAWSVTLVDMVPEARLLPDAVVTAALADTLWPILSLDPQERTASLVRQEGTETGAARLQSAQAIVRSVVTPQIRLRHHQPSSALHVALGDMAMQQVLRPAYVQVTVQSEDTQKLCLLLARAPTTASNAQLGDTEKVEVRQVSVLETARLDGTLLQLLQLALPRHIAFRAMQADMAMAWGRKRVSVRAHARLGNGPQLPRVLDRRHTTA
eukprot:COSAG02_NODE_11909_length_1631_cov_9.765013_1_plen_255_part_00